MKPQQQRMMILLTLSIIFGMLNSQEICDYPKNNIKFCNKTYLDTPISLNPLSSNFTILDQKAENLFYSTIGNIDNSTKLKEGTTETICSFLYKRTICIQTFPTCYYTPLIQVKPCVQLCVNLLSACTFNKTVLEICGTAKTPNPAWGKNLCVPGDGSNPVIENSYLILFFIVAIIGSGVICLFTLFWSNFQFFLQICRKN